jgi:hypothetical protein
VFEAASFGSYSIVMAQTVNVKIPKSAMLVSLGATSRTVLVLAPDRSMDYDAVADLPTHR